MSEFDSEHPRSKPRAEVSIPAFERPLPDPPLVWWAALIGPGVATLVLLLLVYVTQGWEVASSYVGAGATAFFVLGRFVILLATGEPDPDGKLFLQYLDARNLFVMLTWMDVMVAIFVAFHMSVLFKIPWAGGKIEGLVSDGRFILQRQPWIRRAAFLGLVVFVIFPTSTTGSIGGTIFGRLLGMNRVRVVTAILIGSVLGNGMMLVFAEQLGKVVENDSPLLRLIGVGAMVVALFLFERKIKNLKEKYLAEDAALAQQAADKSSDDAS